MEIRLSRCTLRPWRRGDLASLIRHADNRAVSRNLRDRFPYPYTRADGRRWIAWASRSVETIFAIEVDGEAVGGIGLEFQGDVFRRSAEIGYWLGEAYWGRGIMTEAVRAVTELAFTRPEICRVFAGVFASNPASARVLEKAGFVLEGRLRRSVTKDGETQDSLLYARVREDP